MLGRDKPRKHRDAPGLDDEVVIAAAKGLAALLENNQAPPFRAVIMGKLLKLDDTMDDAVKGLVHWGGGEVVQQQNGRALAGKVMPERQNSVSVAQRALREQPDFGKTVNDDTARSTALNCLEHELCGFAKFQIGRIQQALPLIGGAAPKPRGGSISPLEEFATEILALVAEQPDLTLVETVAALRKRRIKASRSSLWPFLDRHNITFKKSLCKRPSGSEQMWRAHADVGCESKACLIPPGWCLSMRLRSEPGAAQRAGATGRPGDRQRSAWSMGDNHLCGRLAPQ